MKLGISILPGQITQAAACGYDFAELNVNDILRMRESEYCAMTDAMDETGLRAEVLRGILPDNTPIVGPSVSSRAISEAMEQTLELARLLGSDTLIFDCPALRRIPAGFDPAEALRQTGNFMRRLQSWAAAENLKVAVMPLRRGECDLIRRLSEAAMIPSLLTLDRIGIAASFYNMSMEAESPNELRTYQSLLMHVCISDPMNGSLPAEGDSYSYRHILSVLAESHYMGRISLECSCAGDEHKMASAHAVIKELLEGLQAK